MLSTEGALAILDKLSITEVTEGGIYTALWNMAQASGVGLELDLRRIPIRQETVEICEYFDLDPYRLWCDGCMLIGTTQVGQVLQQLQAARIPAIWIGRATAGNDRILHNGDVVRYLDRPQPDELYKVLKRQERSNI